MPRPLLQLLFSLNSFAAAMLALYISFSIGLPRPYWAMATAYIVSQPLSGSLRSKGVYRLIGTLVGGFVSVALIPPLSTAPELLCLALALWVGLCLYLSLLDRTPRSYVFILAGYTAAIIGFPVAPRPALVFDTAVARMEEIGLGVVCATLVHSLIFPQGVGPVLNRRISGWLADAQAWTLDVLAGRHDADRERARRRLAADATEIRILSTHLPFDTSNLRDTRRVVQALQDRMTLLLPLVTAIGDRLDVLRREGPTPAGLDTLLDRVRAWAADSAASREEGEQLAAELAALPPPVTGGAGWRDVLLDNLADRLRLLIRAVQDVRDLRSSVRSGARRPPRGLGEVDRGRAVLHRDHYLAFLSALAAVLAVLVCCTLWIGLGWQEGALAAMNAAVFCSFFASQDDPAPAIAGFLWFTLLSLPLVALYQFALLPAIDGFPMLVLALAPPMLAIGYLIADPRWTSRALPVALGVSNGLALAETFSPDFAGFANGNIAQVVGLIAALLITRLVRSVGAEWSARRIQRAGWTALARLASGEGPVDRTRFVVTMLDRAGLLLPRLALAAPDDTRTAADALNDIRIGLNLESLQRVPPSLWAAGSPDGRTAAGRLLQGVARHYRRLTAGRGAPGLAAGRPATPSPLGPDPDGSATGMLGDLDVALHAAASAAARNADAAEAVRALVGLRRSLFPGAPPYVAPTAPAAEVPA